MVKPVEDESKAITIAPHCEVVVYFSVSTGGWLFFTPSRQTLSTQITYELNGDEKTQVVSSSFDIKPPLTSMVIGAITGASLGSAARFLNSTQIFDWQPFFVTTGAALLMSLIATIALARKSGAQGFITVEDFFGGFVIGALIGYGGKEYFDTAIITELKK
jgi:hypothetical protein